MPTLLPTSSETSKFVVGFVKVTYVQIGGEHEHFVTQWANFTDHILMPSIAAWLYPILGATSYNKQQVGKAQENIKKALTYLNTYLSAK